MTRASSLFLFRPVRQGFDTTDHRSVAAAAASVTTAAITDSDHPLTPPRPAQVPNVAVVQSPLMPAAVYVGEGKIAVEQVPCPEPGPGEVLVEIAECGICGSDLHMVLERYAKPGAILGHEWSGIVVAAPSDSGWSPGDRVVGNPAPGCGVCRPCRRGRPSVCLNRATADFVGYRGAFCQYKTVAADGLIGIPDSLPTRVAALAEPMAITLHALRLANVGPDDRVLVTGAGPVGLLLVAVLRARGSLTSP